MIAFVVLSLIKGGADTPSIIPDLPYCDYAYWGINAGMVVTCFAISICLTSLIKKNFKEKKRLNMFEGDKKDFIITPKIATKLMIVSMVAGILATMVGIGGGLVVLPILLSIGVPAL